MRFVPLTVVSLAFAVSMHSVAADTIGGLADVTPVENWTAVALNPAGPTPQLPTVRYVPKDGRNAEVLITLFPSEPIKVNDVESLKRFLRMGCRTFQSSPNAEFTIVEFKARGGPGVYASFDDPSLVGKPVQKGNYKVATAVAVMLSGGVTVQATVLTDARDSVDFREGMKIVESVVTRPTGSRRAPRLDAMVRSGRVHVVRSDLHTLLRLPEGFATPEKKLNRDPGYFSYSNEKSDGMMFSGWLEPKDEFGGDMQKFWTSEKKGLIRGGFAVSDEVFKEVAGWHVVTYGVPLPGAGIQKNLRACRVVGDTWADVHLSVSTPESTWKQLEDALAATDFETR